MGIHIPPVLVLIVCKTVLAGAARPKHRVYQMAEPRLGDRTLDDGVPAQRDPALRSRGRDEAQSHVDDPAPPLNPNFADAAQCARAGIRLATDWDQAHRNTPWRVWRVGCPPRSWICGQEPSSAISCLNAAIGIR